MTRAPIFFDRTGKPLTVAEADALLSDAAYVTVAVSRVTSVTDPSTTCVVATVWLGANYNLLGVTPILFETMVFGEGHPMDRNYWRYATEVGARAGHADIVGRVVETIPGAVVTDLPSGLPSRQAKGRR